MNIPGTKYAPVLSSLIAIGFAAQVLPANARDEHSIERAKLNVELQEKVKDTKPAAYESALNLLAIEYQRNGQTEIAEETFRKSLHYCKLANDEKSKIRIPALLMSWARTLAEGISTQGNVQFQKQEEFEANEAKLRLRYKKINSTTLEALSLIDKGYEAFWKTRFYLDAVNLFKLTKNVKEQVRCKNYLISFCEDCAAKDDVSAKDIRTAVQVLQELAYSALPVRTPKAIPKRPELLSTNDLHTRSEKAFKESETYRLKACALLDRLPKENANRRNAHKDMVLWYLQFGKSVEAQQQRKILSELVGSNDDKILFPQYLGCGQYAYTEPDAHKYKMMCGRG